MLSNLVKSVSNLVQTGASASFPYTIGEEISEWKHSDNKDINIVWSLLEGTKNGTGEKVTIFALENRKNTRKNIVDAALHCLNELKRIRHPHILSYRDELITEDKIMFVSEYVYPLSSCINSINESFIALGLFQISSALSFVHNDLKYVHCLVSPSSIFINKAGDFKLGNFFFAHPHKDIPSHFLANIDLLPIKYRPKEGVNINMLISNPIHSIDSWCFGCVIFELFNGGLFTKPQQLSNLQNIPNSLQPFYKRLLATKPSSRMTLSSLLECDWIQQNSLVQTSKFLSEIAIKSDKEKREFLQHLDCNIESYPSTIKKHKILPALSHLLQHGFGANPVILSCVLKISDTDNDNDMRMVRPLIINMFKNNERGTRINLLKSLPKIINYLDSNCISNDIWPLLINGFTDSSPVLREQSVRCIIHFAPKLKQDIITNSLLPLLNKIQSNDVEPAIRTNICIVLGKIAKFVPFTPNNEELLVKCFYRALNDSFIPCRNASLSSFSANIALFSPKTIANKILPNIIKYCCDPHKSVRDSSFKCVQIGLQKLKQHSLTLPDNTDNNTTNNNDNNDNNDTSYLGNVTNWISGYNDNTNRNNTNDPNKMALKQRNKEQKQEQQQSEQSLEDFLASFNADLNKQNVNNPDLKIKHKKKDKKKHSKSKEKISTKQQDVDDFFDDW